MSGWPEIKTAKALVAEGLVPWSETALVKMARTYSVGRKHGRCYVLRPTI
jgi:hypothetical protein